MKGLVAYAIGPYYILQDSMTQDRPGLARHGQTQPTQADLTGQARPSQARPSPNPCVPIWVPHSRLAPSLADFNHSQCLPWPPEITFSVCIPLCMKRIRSTHHRQLINKAEGGLSKQLARTCGRKPQDSRLDALAGQRLARSKDRNLCQKDHS